MRHEGAILVWEVDTKNRTMLNTKLEPRTKILMMLIGGCLVILLDSPTALFVWFLGVSRLLRYLAQHGGRLGCSVRSSFLRHGV